MMRDVSLIYYVSFRFSTFLFPFSRLPPFPSFFRSLIFVPFFPPQLRPNLSSLSSNSWHSPRRLRVLHRYILASSFFFILISYSLLFVRGSVLPSLLLPSSLPPVFYLSRITRPPLAQLLLSLPSLLPR